MTMDNHSTDARSQRAALLDRVYRRISLLDDEALAQLDRLITTADRVEFYEEAGPSRRLTRRGFLVGLLVGGASVGALGGGAWLLQQQEAQASLAAAPTPPQAVQPTLHGEPLSATAAPATASPDTTLHTEIDDLRRQLADSQGERLAMRTELDSARAEASQLATELQTSRNDVAYLQQVVALYRQMEAAGLDNLLLAGLGPLGVALLAIQTGRDALSAGIEEAAARLATVEVQSPVIANGLLWLEEQINLLAQTLQSLEDTLSGVVEPVAPVAQQIGDFIGEVLRLLPFGVGDQIRRGLEAIALILTHIPELIASINPLLITPLRQWVSPDETKGLVAEVVQPISEHLISPAQGMVDSTTALETTYNEQLATPVGTALDMRAEIRRQIIALAGVA